MSASGDCGCGGGGSSSPVAVKGGHDCGCGGGGCGCEVSMTGEGFVRPRYFGGMLLTEDDLQAQVDYALAKRKLTNRNVIGSGVVCGLEVSCHPCDPGKVSVNPGYAIDCCGNDILVSCAEEVDVIALVRDLRLRKGVDCGEPCDEQPRREYSLYLRYAESPMAPVAPYAADDCATGECEFSRIREGYCFELRCDPPAAEPTVLDTLAACTPDEKIVNQDQARLAGISSLARRHDAIVKTLAAGAEPLPSAPTKSEFDRAERSDAALSDNVALLARSVGTLALVAGAAKDDDAPKLSLNAPRRELIADRSSALAAKILESDALEAQPPAESARMERVLRIAAEQPDLSSLNAFDRMWLSDGLTAHEANVEYTNVAESMRDRIVDELGARGHTSCAEYRKLSKLRFDGLTDSSKDDVAALEKAYQLSLSACACSAFDPPCPTCTDDAVVIAKLRVDGCEVTDVCALERRWVLSPRALGYWLPVVEMLRHCLERACCDDGATVPTRRPDGEAGATAPPMPRERYSVLDCFTTALDEATKTVERALTPRYAPLALTATTTGGAAALTTATAPAAAAPSGAGTESQIAALEAKIAELGKRIDELSAAKVPEEKQ